MKVKKKMGGGEVGAWVKGVGLGGGGGSGWMGTEK